MALDPHKNAAIWLAEMLAEAPNPEVEHVQSLNQEEACGLFEAYGYADFVEYNELCRMLAWNEKSVRGNSLILKLVQIGAFTYRLHGDSDETVPLTPKPMNENLDDIWQIALASLELPSTRQLLSQQAVLISLNSKDAVVQVAANWMKMVQSRSPLVEQALSSATGRHCRVTLKAADSHQFYSSKPPPPPPRIVYPMRILLVDDERDQERILSKLFVYRNLPFSKTTVSGFDAKSLDLVIRAWTHLGGDIDELSGVPSYLSED